MKSETPRVEKDFECSFEERIDILFHEIELAVKWDRPSILFAIYRAAPIRDEVNRLLTGKLESISQKTHLIRTDQFDFVAGISQLTDLPNTVLFIDGFNWDCGAEGVRVLTEFNKHREYFIDNNLRAIFWLYEGEVSEFADKAAECWIMRHRVVEFVDPAPQAPAQEEPARVEQVSPSPQEANPACAAGCQAQEPAAESRMADAGNARELLNQGILAWRQGDTQGALKMLDLAAGIAAGTAAALADQALQAQCQNALALVHAETGNIEPAVTAYQQAIALSPESGFLWNNLAQLLARSERNEEAINAFKQALACSPDDFLSWNGVGHTYLKMGLYQNAIAAFERSIQASPVFEDSWAGIGQACLASGDAEKAVAPLRKAVELNPQSLRGWIELARAYTLLERPAEAASVLRKAMELNPDEASLWFQLGSLLLQDQQYVESIPVFQHLLALDPGNVDAKVSLADAEFQLGDYETSAVLYEECLPLFKEPGAAAFLWDRLGDTCMHLKEYEKAIHAYEQAGSPTRETPAEAVQAAGDAQVEAESEGSEPVILPEGSLPAERGETMNEANQVYDLRTAKEWNDLGNAQLKKGDFKEAILAFTRAIEMAPNDCWPYIQNLADVHYQKGKLKGRLSAGQGEEPEIWEGDDEPDTTPVFGLEDIPVPERCDHSMEPAQELSASTSIEAPAGQAAAGETLEASLSAAPESEVSQILAAGWTGTETAPADLTLEADMPRNSIDWNELGNSHARARRYDQAIDAYKRSIELNPRYGQPYNNLGLLYYHQGKFDTAVLLFKKSIDLLESHEEKAAAWNKIGDCHRRLGDYANALQAYQEASGMMPPVSPVMARARATLLENMVAG